jgi:hypothetical protein
MQEILDLIDDKEIKGVEHIYMQPPAGDDSDGYDMSDTEQGDGVKMKRNILQVDRIFAANTYNCT